jgi:hypothetical protein
MHFSLRIAASTSGTIKSLLLSPMMTKLTLKCLQLLLVYAKGEKLGRIFETCKFYEVNCTEDVHFRRALPIIRAVTYIYYQQHQFIPKSSAYAIKNE